VNKYIYLNNAATSYPKPQSVISAVNAYLNSIPFHSQRTGFDLQQRDIINDCRTKLAKLINAENQNRIIFTSGATESLNLAIKGLSLDEGHVVTTSMEHNSVLRPLKHLEKDGYIELSIVESDEKGYVSATAIEKHFKKNTKAIVVNHCSNVTGAVLDLESISRITKKNNIIFMVDASQSMGVLDIDVQKCGIDILVFTGHKSLYGTPGIGGLYIDEDIELKPLKTGGTGIKSELLYQPKEIPLYFEAGTPNMPGIAALNAGLDFIFNTGKATIKNKKEEIITEIYSGLTSIEEVQLQSIFNSEFIPQIISFNIKGISPNEAGYILENSFGIIIRAGLHCAPLIHKNIGTFPEGSIRVSPSFFTTIEDVHSLINSVQQIRKMEVKN